LANEHQWTSIVESTESVDFFDFQLLREHSLPAECIEIELTENVLQTGRSTIDGLSALRALGAGIALDDFGTGSSSLTSLEQLPLTRVKLDRSLITCIDSNTRALAIAQSIIELGQRLGLKMTAEGIERPEQLCLLWEHEKLYLQGYLLSRPVSVAQLPAAIADLPMRMRSLLLSAPSLARTNRDERRIVLSGVTADMSSR
jgi:EAL domain-containing protein (putative c-di-GMP-specific phosphodiesterase class I)